MSYEAFSDAVYLAFNDETTGKATVSWAKYCIKARLKIILSFMFEKGVINLHYNLECLFTLKGISPQVSRLHVKERTMTDVFTHSHPITSLSAFINTLMFTDKEVSQFFIRKNSA